jgi:hypothetical protein
MYLFCDSGNLAKGKIGDLNVITMTFRGRPISVEGSFSAFLVRFLGAGGFSSSASGTLGGRPRRLGGAGTSSALVEKPLACMLSFAKGKGV